jgi:hypothetical protein
MQVHGPQFQFIVFPVKLKSIASMLNAAIRPKKCLTPKASVLSLQSLNAWFILELTVY